MNSARKAAALFVLAAFMAGCRHNAKTTPPAAAEAPMAPAATLAKNMPPPDLPPAQLPSINPPQPVNTAPPKPKPQKSSHHKPKHTTIEASPAETPSPASGTNRGTTEQAANGAGTNASPIGQLTVEGEATNGPRRHHILDEIDSTEKGLDGIKRPLNKDEQTTAAQIRTFIAKARDAMKQEDLDGANTLVTKAKVLLAELTNP
jgi:hypothetical protein